MNLKVRFNKVANWGKQNSPDILLVTGLVEGAVGVFLACRATLKAKKIMDESLEEKVISNDDGTCVITVPARKKMAKAIDICRIYLAPAALLAASFSAARSACRFTCAFRSVLIVFLISDLADDERFSPSPRLLRPSAVREPSVF